MDEPKINGTVPNPRRPLGDDPQTGDYKRRFGNHLTPCNPDWSHHVVNEVTIKEEDETFEEFDERIANLEKAVYLIQKVLGIMNADTIKGVADEPIGTLTIGDKSFDIKAAEITY